MRSAAKTSPINSSLILVERQHDAIACRPRTRPLPIAASFVLDVVRLMAAILVVIAHAGHPEFSTGFLDRQFLGDLAVPVFFVLSGFVIRFVTVTREHTLQGYLIDRASRIYSVALPAMALTLAVSSICLVTNKAYFVQHIAPVSNHAMLRVTLNLTFLSQVWGLNTVQFANSPFWSLSYECLFYAAYGLFFYLRGVRRVVALLVWAVIAGPPILFLFPLWILGCVLYDVYQSTRTRLVGQLLRVLTLSYVTASLTLAVLHKPGLLLAPIHFEQAFAALPNPLTLIHQVSIRATMHAIGSGSLAAVAMFFLLLLSDLIPLGRHLAISRHVRRLADGSFAIYLMHYPLMMLACSLNLLRPNAPVLDCLTITAIVLLLIAAASPLDHLKSNLRGVLGKTLVHSIPTRQVLGTDVLHIVH